MQFILILIFNYKKALSLNCFMDVKFVKSFYKILFGKTLKYHDLKD